jgi:starvation-inducible DNA-binding protein
MIAERLTALGGQADGTARTTARNSRLEEYPLTASKQSEHLDAMSSALAAFGDKVRNASSEAANAGDAGTKDLFIEVFSAADKSLWLMESFVA